VARIVGVDLPREKRIDVGLTYIYGIGPTLSKMILAKAGVDPSKRVKNLSEEEISRIRKVIDNSGIKVEGELRKEVSLSIKRLIEIGCYRGLRHKRGLPVRGQRTHTNARTWKGPRLSSMRRKKK